MGAGSTFIDGTTGFSHGISLTGQFGCFHVFLVTIIYYLFSKLDIKSGTSCAFNAFFIMITFIST